MARDEEGLRLIVAYKLLKAAVQLVMALLLLLLPHEALTGALGDLASALREHATGAWSLRLAAVLIRVDTPRHIHLLIVALVADGLLSLLEGWSLHRRYAWGRWLVIVATSSLLPIEVFELTRRVTAGRLVILVLNIVIVAYLYARRHPHRHHRPG